LINRSADGGADRLGDVADGRGLGLDWPAFGGPRGAIRLQGCQSAHPPPNRHYRETIPVRLTEEAVAAVDGDMISRSEAIRRLLDVR
jgi:hypothetical protein